MNGLEIEEIYLSDLENSFTIGAEYYGKIYVNTANTIKSLNHKTLHDISKKITDGDHGSPNYQNSGVIYLLSESVQEGYVDFSKCRFITSEKNDELKRSELHPGDIVITKTGVYFGKSAVIPSSICKANMIAHVGKIELKRGYNPYYLSTFLNCKYGYYQLRRRGIKATRPEIKLVEFSEILIPVFSDKFDLIIESIIKRANQIMSSAAGIMQQCESYLLQILGLDNKIGTDSNCYTKYFSKSFSNSGRLDAEYYQPKYDALFYTLSKFKTKKLGGKNGIVDYMKSIEPGSEAYVDKGIPFVRVSDISEFEISEPEIKLRRNVFPTPEVLFPKKDTILLSKDGSVGIAYKVESDMSVITSGALLHLTVRNKSEVLPDYLTLVLNSPIVRLQAERDSSGAIIQHWKPSEIENVIIPVLDMDIQKEIASKVQESLSLRKQSKQLLEDAKLAVEMAIEQGEEAALKWLKANARASEV